MSKSLEVILSPALSHLYDFHNKVVVVIDVLRATTTICAALDNGASSVKPVLNVEQAQELQRQGFLIGGERNGIKIGGFDFGNSPSEYVTALVENKDLVLTTTNGTKCINISSPADSIIIGAFVNLLALIDFLKQQEKDVLLFCAGWKDQVNVEDTLCAGYLCRALLDDFRSEGDAHHIALSLALSSHVDLHEALKNANHALRFERLGVDDLPYCVSIDKHPVVPIMKNGKLVIA
jgi:2-phosphosulfolactate phosphatase